MHLVTDMFIITIINLQSWFWKTNLVETISVLLWLVFSYSTTIMSSPAWCLGRSLALCFFPCSAPLSCFCPLCLMLRNSTRSWQVKHLTRQWILLITSVKNAMFHRELSPDVRSPSFARIVCDRSAVAHAEGGEEAVRLHGRGTLLSDLRFSVSPHVLQHQDAAQRVCIAIR